MKKSLLLSVVASTMIMAGGTIAPETTEVEVQAPAEAVSSGGFGDALKNGKFTAALRAFYFDRGFDEDNTGKANATALTAGGIIKYESAAYHGLKFGLAHYSSTRLGSLFSREEGSGTSILGRSGENLAFLGEAYLQYDLGNTMFKVGRQQLSTPLMQNHDLRILPSVYEAAILRNTDIPDTMIEIGFVDRYTGFTSKENAFLDKKTGEDGLAYISMSNKSISGLSLRAQYIEALTDTNARQSYTYADAKYSLPFGTNTYIKGQFGMNEYLEGEDSTLVGAKIGTTLGMFSVAALYDKVSDNAFQAFESGPMYSDWQQGYGPYEASTAFGGQIVFKPMAGLSLKVGYVDVQSDTNMLVDDFTELNIDAKYTINDWSKIRVRYSMKDQSDASEALRFDGIDGNGGREDRDDFRIIYYMNF
jgi:hypothetical protein